MQKPTGTSQKKDDNEVLRRIVAAFIMITQQLLCNYTGNRVKHRNNICPSLTCFDRKKPLTTLTVKKLLFCLFLMGILALLIYLCGLVSRKGCSCPVERKGNWISVNAFLYFNSKVTKKVAHGAKTHKNVVNCPIQLKKYY